MFAESSEMSNIILMLLAILTLLVFVWVIYAVIYSVFMFIFSWGMEERVKKARASIRYAILWFILTLVILIAIPWFLRAIKVPAYEQYTSWNIFKTAKNLVYRIVDIFQQTWTPLNPKSSDSNYYNL